MPPLFKRIFDKMTSGNDFKAFFEEINGGIKILI